MSRLAALVLDRRLSDQSVQLQIDSVEHSRPAEEQDDERRAAAKQQPGEDFAH